MTAQHKIERLMRKGLQLLQEEKRAILSADYDTLGTLNSRKEAIAEEISIMVAQLPGRGSAGAKLWRDLGSLADILSRRAEENQSLLVAAKDGVAEARQRIEIVLGAERDMGIYDSRGTRLSGRDSQARSFTF